MAPWSFWHERLRCSSALLLMQVAFFTTCDSGKGARSSLCLLAPICAKVRSTFVWGMIYSGMSLSESWRPAVKTFSTRGFVSSRLLC